MSSKQNGSVLPVRLPPHHEINPGKLDDLTREKMLRDYYHLCKTHLWSYLGREPMVPEIMEYAQERIEQVNLFTLTE